MKTIVVKSFKNIPPGCYSRKRCDMSSGNFTLLSMSNHRRWSRSGIDNKSCSITKKTKDE